MNMDVIAQLATVAARASMQKEGRFLGKLFTKPGAGGVGRRFAPMRTLATTGLAGYGMYNQSQHETGATLNPFTWGGWGNNQAQHDRSFDKWKGLNDQGQDELNQAYMQEDSPGWFSKSPQDIEKQLKDGTYGQSGYSLGGLNPFYRPGMKAYEQDVGRINMADQSRQSRIQARMKTLGLRGNATDYDADIASTKDPVALEQLKRQKAQSEQFGGQLNSLKTRMTQAQTIPGIKDRMQAQPSPAGNTPAGHWQTGNRPGYPGAFQGWALNPHDYRRDPRSHDVWEEVLARSGQQGGLARPH